MPNEKLSAGDRELARRAAARDPERDLKRLAIYDVIADGESPCPECNAEWQQPVDEDGSVIRDAVNQVMYHKATCSGYNPPKDA
jgi:hypothetical protein